PQHQHQPDGECEQQLHQAETSGMTIHCKAPCSLVTRLVSVKVSRAPGVPAERRSSQLMLMVTSCPLTAPDPLASLPAKPMILASKSCRSRSRTLAAEVLGGPDSSLPHV